MFETEISWVSIVSVATDHSFNCENYRAQEWRYRQEPQCSERSVSKIQIEEKFIQKHEKHERHEMFPRERKARIWRRKNIEKSFKDSYFPSIFTRSEYFAYITLRVNGDNTPNIENQWNKVNRWKFQYCWPNKNGFFLTSTT